MRNFQLISQINSKLQLLHQWMVSSFFYDSFYFHFQPKMKYGEKSNNIIYFRRYKNLREKTLRTQFYTTQLLVYWNI
jgi:hypothetical protein